MELWKKLIVVVVAFVVIVSGTAIVFSIVTGYRTTTTETHPPVPSNNTAVGMAIVTLPSVHGYSNVSTTVTTSRMVTLIGHSMNGRTFTEEVIVVTVAKITEQTTITYGNAMATVNVYVESILGVVLAQLQVSEVWTLDLNNGSIVGYQQIPTVLTHTWWPWSTYGASGYTSLLVPGQQILAHGQAVFETTAFGFVINSVTAWADIYCGTWGQYYYYSGIFNN